MVSIWVVELWVLPGIELDGEQRSDEGGSGVGEEAEVLAGEGVRGRGGVGEDEAEAEAWAGSDLGEDREDEGGGEGGEGGGIGSRSHGELCWVEHAADGVLNGVVCEADDGGVEHSVVDESEVGGIGDVGEGVEEKFESRSGREEDGVEKEEEGEEK